jgi:hypothetical protein
MMVPKCYFYNINIWSAVKLNVVYVQLGIPIPSTLPPHFRPTPIPVRQIVSNETLVPQNDDETASNGTSTTTSATTAEHLSATGKSDDGLKFKHQVDNVLSKTCDNDGLKRNVQQFTKYTENLTYGKFATLAPKSRQNQRTMFINFSLFVYVAF